MPGLHPHRVGLAVGETSGIATSVEGSQLERPREVVVVERAVEDGRDDRDRVDVADAVGVGRRLGDVELLPEDLDGGRRERRAQGKQEAGAGCGRQAGGKRIPPLS
jgi:hypothetical protein